MGGGQDKIIVGREQREFVSDAELREQSVDRPDLHACATAAISQRRGIDVILPVRHEERQCRESINDVPACARPCKSLQQLLQD